jgi:rhodanese-related sulfurtransferase
MEQPAISKRRQLLDMKMMKYLIFFLLGSLLSGGCKSKTPFTSVDAEVFAREISNAEVQLVDVRTPEEYAEGHIAGAINMNVNDVSFDKQIASLDKNRPVAHYCRSGRRSKLAATRTAKLGYKVIELNGGILSWKGDLEQ